MYLGLDLSLSSTGVAVVTADGKVFTKAITTDKKDYVTTQERMHHIIHSITCIIEKWDIKYIVFEGYAFGSSKFGSNNLTTLAELKGAILYELYCNYEYIQYVTITTQQMKKYLTGKGLIAAPKSLSKAKQATYKKQAIIDAVKYNYNLAVDTSDEADAVGLALICRNWATGSPLSIDNKKLLAIQKEVIETVIATRIEQLKAENDQREAILKRKLKKSKIVN
jgi:Holliday junction resolvasome RuvABC endonuclease subunit